jgi:hypothetical protein
MKQTNEWDRAVAELKPIAIDELQRSRCPVWRELVHVLEIGWSGASNNIFDIEQFSKLLQPGTTADCDRFRLEVVTRVLPDLIESRGTDLVSAFERFLRQDGALQERVLTARALATKLSKDGDAEEIEDVRRPEFIHKRAVQLAACDVPLSALG